MTDYSENQQYVSKFIANGDGFLFSMNSCLAEHQRALVKLQQSKKQSVELAFIVPAIANGAFACELYFKAIICMESGNATRGHELVVLHEKLSDESKNSLLKISGFSQADMRKTLEQCNKAFEKARYFELEEANPKNLKKLVLAAQRQTSVLLNKKLESGSFETA